MEISRWRKPPVAYENEISPRQGVPLNVSPTGHLGRDGRPRQAYARFLQFVAKPGAALPVFAFGVSLMPSTYLSLHYHLVFGTKNHEPTIQARWRKRLHAYLGGVVKALNGVPESIGGVSEHVHLLVGLRSTHTLADVPGMKLDVEQPG